MVAVPKKVINPITEILTNADANATESGELINYLNSLEVAHHSSNFCSKIFEISGLDTS